MEILLNIARALIVLWLIGVSLLAMVLLCFVLILTVGSLSSLIVGAIV
jgi:hypothetical protein